MYNSLSVSTVVTSAFQKSVEKLMQHNWCGQKKSWKIQMGTVDLKKKN
jgi:hypothetical protein